MKRALVTESDIRKLIESGTKRLSIAPGTLLTPSATELALNAGIAIVEEQKNVTKQSPRSGARDSTSEGSHKQVVAFGSDHGGFEVKEVLRKQAEEWGYEVIDLGTSSAEPCDYPDFAYAVATAVASGRAWRGIMIDGAGIGSCMVANKVRGVRAACCHNEFVARNAREHNDANVLTLGSRVTGIEVCKEIMRVWLESWFSGGRHKVRVDKIIDVEGRFGGPAR